MPGDSAHTGVAEQPYAVEFVRRKAAELEAVIESLGDGEAATLAYAHENGSSAVIDEKKATRVAAKRFGSLRVATTIDILSHESVRLALGRRLLAEATFKALRQARMQVRDYQFDWVANLIGNERVAACSSLKRLAAHRSRHAIVG